jgi:cytochrome c5
MIQINQRMRVFAMFRRQIPDWSGNMRAHTLRLVHLAILISIAAAPAIAEPGPASQRLKEGKAIYSYACGRCHDSGQGGAPVIGDAEAWSTRSSLWAAVLFEHAQKGYLGMPAGGGDARFTRYDIEVASEYILQTTFPDRPED